MRIHFVSQQCCVCRLVPICQHHLPDVILKRILQNTDRILDRDFCLRLEMVLKLQNYYSTVCSIGLTIKRNFLGRLCLPSPLGIWLFIYSAQHCSVFFLGLDHSTGLNTAGTRGQFCSKRKPILLFKMTLTLSKPSADICTPTSVLGCERLMYIACVLYN